MKNIPMIALATLLMGAVGPVQAGPLDFLFRQHQEHRDDRRDDRHRGNDRDRHRGWERDHDRRRPMSTEARAQLRLRELGYYRGAIDGSFGRASRSALARFQRDYRMRPTGRLDERTRRALRI